MIRTWSRLVLTVVLACTAALVAPAQAAQATTKVTVRVQGCDGCRITAERTFNQGSTAWHRSATVRNGKVTFTVPRAYTRGLYFVVGRPKGAVTDGAARIAVSRYPRFKPGTKITANQAKVSSMAHHCWAGSKKSSATLRLKVTRFASKDAYSGKPGFDIRAFFSPTLYAIGKAHSTHQGNLGAQDYFAC